MGIYIAITPALTESQEILGDMTAMQQLVLFSEPQHKLGTWIIQAM